MLSACDKGDNSSVKIGDQIWMVKNLNVDKFRNGDPIPEAKTDDEWIKAGEDNQPAWCYYKNDSTNGADLGKLYNWYAVNDKRGLSPAGWHIPSDTEWKTLIDYLGGEEIAGREMKSRKGWELDDNSPNSSGFTGLPGSWRSPWGEFAFSGTDACWWSTTECDTNNAFDRSLTAFFTFVQTDSTSKACGLSVRCIKD